MFLCRVFISFCAQCVWQATDKKSLAWNLPLKLREMNIDFILDSLVHISWQNFVKTYSINIKFSPKTIQKTKKSKCMVTPWLGLLSAIISCGNWNNRNNNNSATRWEKLKKEAQGDVWMMHVFVETTQKEPMTTATKLTSKLKFSISTKFMA